MGLTRLLMIIAIVWVVWFIYRRVKQGKHVLKRNKVKKHAISNVKQCSVCGVHVPENEVLESNGRFYCSQKHLKSDV